MFAWNILHATKNLVALLFLTSHHITNSRALFISIYFGATHMKMVKHTALAIDR